MAGMGLAPISGVQRKFGVLAEFDPFADNSEVPKKRSQPATKKNITLKNITLQAVAAGSNEPISDSAGASRGCLINGTPDLYQPLDGDMANWERSNWANKGVFNCTWRPDNIQFRNGIMILDLTKDSGEYPYASGEYRTTSETYSYGYYETRMKAAKGAGLVAGTFFTYAGVWGQPSHNEIDFEVLGKETDKVQLNYFYAGAGKGSENEVHISLGFDASKDFHNYGFKWSPTSIVWYVDGKPVHTATTNIPKDPCKIMVNFWNGTSEVSAWLGGVYSGNGDQVQYDWIKFKNLEGSQAEASTPAKVSPKKAKTAKTQGKPFETFVRSVNPFNGANGRVFDSKVTLLSAAGNNDAGLSVGLRSSLKGTLSFDYSGKVTGGLRGNKFTVIFIKAGANGNWRNDVNLKEISIDPADGTNHADIDIPEGATKMNIMLIGNGFVEINLDNVMVSK